MATCPICGEHFEEGAKYCHRDGTALVPESERIGQVVGGRYRLVAKLGEGGVGEIFVAEHIYLGKGVAVKLLRPQVASDPDAVGRLQREARSASAIGHPNIVRVEDFGLSEQQAYLAMELLEGAPLGEHIARPCADLPLLFEIMAQVCDGLAAAHAAGVIHRDLKPANIVITQAEDGGLLAKVLDFGIAKLSTGDANLTRTGTLVGTPYYMAPEQALGNAVDHRADIYAIGVMLYEFVTGSVPFDADSFIAILHKHTADPPALPSSRLPAGALSTDVDHLILRCLEKSPEARFSDMASLAGHLRQLAAGEPLAADPARAPAPVPAPGYGHDEERSSLGRAETAAEDSSEPAGDAEASRRARRSLDTGAATGPGSETDFGATRPGPVARRRVGLGVALGVGGAAVLGAIAVGATRGTGDAEAGGGPPDAASGWLSQDAGPGDADPADAELAPQEPEPWSYADEHSALSYRATVRPAVAEPRSRLDVELEIEPEDPALADAIARGNVEARFHFEYYRDHRPVSEVARDVGEDGEVVAILSVPDPGKYHVGVNLRDEHSEYASFRFDICVGADPRVPEEADDICPRMNP